VETVEAGHMTKDLAILIRADQSFLSTEEFMDAVEATLKRKLG
jgi:isocitrate dehydrogenase